MFIQTIEGTNVETSALIDSGAGFNYIDYRFVRKHNLPTRPKQNPFQPTTADGSPIKRKVTTECILHTDIAGTKHQIIACVTDLHENLILGMQWLEKANPQVNWTKRTMTIEEIPDEEGTRPLHPLTSARKVLERIKPKKLNKK